MRLTVDIRPGIQKIFQQIVPIKPSETHADAFSRYVRNLNAARTLVSEHEDSINNFPISSLPYEFLQKDQKNVIDARLLEEQIRLNGIKIKGWRKLFGRVPLWPIEQDV